MARCPKLDPVESNWFGPDAYKCELTGLKIYSDEPKVKFVCDADSGHEYEKCEAYKNR